MGNPQSKILVVQKREIAPINILKGIVQQEIEALDQVIRFCIVTLINKKFAAELFLFKLSFKKIRYAAELHQVHIADDGNVSVVAVIFKYGKPNPVVAKIQNKLNELAYKAKRHEEAPITLRHFHSTELRKRSHKYYRYVGSLTNPPCTENVIWHVHGKVRSISREQVKALKAPLYQRSKNNARPFQPRNGRHVELYEDKPFAQGNQYPKNKCKQW
ncbi:hypothetical protein Pfo_028465 [Paulownia fortunei]|nr:hypothetical protein Pfo_028465 [Paulownia fortunei]